MELGMICAWLQLYPVASYPAQVSEATQSLPWFIMLTISQATLPVACRCTNMVHHILPTRLCPDPAGQVCVKPESSPVTALSTLDYKLC